ncbi:ShlB/FhaC/HecB family hemolysin secretion/activation protein [Phormidesmis sp. 146-35]
MIKISLFAQSIVALLAAVSPVQAQEQAAPVAQMPQKASGIQESNIYQTIQCDEVLRQARSSDNQSEIEYILPVDRSKIRGIRIVGSQRQSKQNSIISAFDLCTILKTTQTLGQEQTPERLAVLQDAITLHYIQAGFLTSGAAQAEFADGVVIVKVIEGRLNPNITITGYGGGQYDDDRAAVRVRERLQRGIQTPLNIRNLEEQVKLLEIDPALDEEDPTCKKVAQGSQVNPNFCEGRRLSATLRPSGIEGQSLLNVEMSRSRFIRANLSVDNSAPPSLGAERLRTTVNLYNSATFGDVLFSSVQTAPARFSEDSLKAISLGYQYPLSSINDTLQVRLENRRERIVQSPFDEFGFRAKSELYEVTYRRPLVRSYSREFALSISFTFQNGQTFVFNDTPFPFGIGPDKDGVSRTSVFRFGQDYIQRGVTGTWLLQSQFSLGTGLFNATNNRSSTPDGQFISWTGQMQRLQQLGANQLLILQAAVQLSPNSLLPSQQFVLGGGQSLRGYRQNIRFGDNGFRFSIENQITLLRDAQKKPMLQVAPFIDVGSIWNVSGNPNTLPRQKLIAGAGVGLLWRPLARLNLRLDFALPLIDLQDKGNDLQDKGLYFSVNYGI